MDNRPTNAAEVVAADKAAAVEAARVAVAMRAPHSYTELCAARRAGTLVELLGQLDSYTLRAQAVRYTLEGPLGLDVAEVERRFVKLLGAARFGRAA
jgi:hypothetical protein